jgi:hypothetical protein
MKIFLDLSFFRLLNCRGIVLEYVLWHNKNQPQGLVSGREGESFFTVHSDVILVQMVSLCRFMPIYKR